MNSLNIHNIEWKWAFGPWGGAGGVIHIKVIEWWKHLSELTFLSEFRWIEINFAPLRHAALANICGAGRGGVGQPFSLRGRARIPDKYVIFVSTIDASAWCYFLLWTWCCFYLMTLSLGDNWSAWYIFIHQKAWSKSPFRTHKSAI